MNEVFLEHSDFYFIKVHDEKQCEGRSCTVHNKSIHSMRSFPQSWRGDLGLIERICPHGIGHPDPDDPRWDHVHGCDGCCADAYSQREAVKD